jgi:molybdopterin converting factor small subunit
MMIAVRLFARARDLGGRDVLPVEVPAEATVAELRRSIRQACPALADLLARSRIAVGVDFVGDEFKLQAGVEAAIIPPVSGG